MFAFDGYTGKEAPGTFATARRIVSWFFSHVRRTFGSHSFLARTAARAARCARTLTPRTFVSNFRSALITGPPPLGSDVAWRRPPPEAARIAPTRIPARPGPLLNEYDVSVFSG